MLPIYTQIGNIVKIRIKLISIFDKKLAANNVILVVPVPKNTVSVDTVSLIGKALY